MVGARPTFFSRCDDRPNVHPVIVDAITCGQRIQIVVACVERSGSVGFDFFHMQLEQAGLYQLDVDHVIATAFQAGNRLFQLCAAGIEKKVTPYQRAVDIPRRLRTHGRKHRVDVIALDRVGIVGARNCRHQGESEQRKSQPDRTRGKILQWHVNEHFQG